ncbi:glycine betaine ABC transporter substrate-binding protein [Aeromonas jandaei]|uniref:glycine betaine ABC transporter substrate-binding protein n=1 Tax=Aeromonas jandaei TaxID=650 RepID=UPI00191DB673|nr:glycine betaine ABC transporter substrate-binding protein [Aeromonas jandaei]MBL0625351.1 glycine betaine ABC transporter substrate-binding protein [Aeromonas jandaei]
MMIKLGVTDLSFHRMTGALVRYVLEKHGHEVITSYSPHVANFEQLAQGELDLLTSAWLPYSHGAYLEKVQTQQAVRKLGLHYESYAFWGVPDYVPADQVSEVKDLLKPSVISQMTPLIQGIGEGAGISRFSRRAMAVYDLEAAGYAFRNGSEAECLAAFEQAVAEERWVVVPLWRPQYLNARYAIRELKDPEGLFGGKDQAVLLAREDRLEQLGSRCVAELDSLRFGNELIERLDYRVSCLGESLEAVAKEAIDGRSNHLVLHLHHDPVL